MQMMKIDFDKELLNIEEAIAAAEIDVAMLEWNGKPDDFGEHTFMKFVELYDKAIVQKVPIIEHESEYYALLYTAKWFEWYRAFTMRYAKLFNDDGGDDEDDQPKEQEHRSNSPYWLSAMGIVYEHTGINFADQWQLTVTDWYAYFDYGMEIVRQKQAHIQRMKRR